MKNIYVLIWLMFSVGISVRAEIKPTWITNPPNEGNNSYSFKVVVSESETLQNASAQSIRSLVSMVEHDENIKIEEFYEVEEKSQYSSLTKTDIEDFKDKYVLKIGTHIDKQLYAQKYKEYIEEFKRNGKTWIRLYVLYAVQRNNSVSARFDEVKFTTKYGMRGFVRSMIVPGWGQIYKGSAVKGGFILGGAVAVAAGIIITENTRADYIKKMHEQPKFADVYNSKATDWETARNVCIGAAAALYIYNLVDAVAADGAERAIVKKRNNNFSFAPVVTPDGGGFSLVYKF